MIDIKGWTTAELLFAREFLKAEISKYSDEENRDEHGRWSSGSSSAPNPVYLNSNTGPFSISNTTSSYSHGEGIFAPNSSVPFDLGSLSPSNASDGNVLTQQIGGSSFTFFKKGKKFNLFMAQMENGDNYRYSDNQYTLRNSQFPDGLTFRNNGMAPTEGPAPNPLDYQDFNISFDHKLKYSEDEARDEKGRWTNGGGDITSPEHQARVTGSLTHGPTLRGSQIGRNAVYATLSSKLHTTGGFTYPEPKSGYMVGVKGQGRVIDGFASPKDIQSYHEQVVKGIDTGRIGGWYHEGKTYLDVVMNIPSRDTAITVGRANNQTAIWDVAAKQEIPTGGTGLNKGGSGSGNFGHSGRQGEIGGSGAGSTTVTRGSRVSFQGRTGVVVETGVKTAGKNKNAVRIKWDDPQTIRIPNYPDKLVTESSIPLNHKDLTVIKGGSGSGNFGHSGRQGEVGGSGETDLSNMKEVYKKLGPNADIRSQIGRSGWILPDGKFIGTRGSTHAEILNRVLKVQLYGSEKEISISKIGPKALEAGWIRVNLNTNFELGKPSGKSFLALQNHLSTKSWVGLAYIDFNQNGKNQSAEFTQADLERNNFDLIRTIREGLSVKSVSTGLLFKGGSGSGNFGHEGRPGEVGGSGGGGSLPGETEHDIGYSGSERIETIDEAIQLLGEGKGIMFSRPEHAITMLRVLGNMAKEAKAQGKEAKVYDLCKVSVTGTNLFCGENVHIPRSQMPQLKGVPTKGSYADRFFPKDSRGEVDLAPSFRTFLESTGHVVEDKNEYADRLRASQREMNGAKVAGMMEAIETGRYVGTGRLFVSNDNYIIDGHHTWAAQVGLQIDTHEPISIPVARLDMNILQALSSANVFALTMGMPRMSVSKSAVPDPLDMSIVDWLFKGGSGSGNFGHEGRTGEVGGSGPGGVTPYISNTKTSHPPFSGQHMDQYSKEQQAMVERELGKSGITSETVHRNMTDLYARAQTSMSPVEMDKAKNWYQIQSDKMQAISQKTGVPFDQVVAATATLSPNAEWDHTFKDGTLKETNLNRTLSVIEQDKLHPEMDARTLGRSFNSGGIREAAVRAEEILDGKNPNEILGGAKVRSFYDNLRFPKNDGPITIDRHMISALSSRNGRDQLGEKETHKALYGTYGRGGPGNNGAYPWFAQQIQDFAHENGMMGHEMQAVLWTQWRNEHA